MLVVFLNRVPFHSLILVYKSKQSVLTWIHATYILRAHILYHIALNFGELSGER